MKLSRDGWTGLVVLATSLVLFWQTLGLRDNPLVPIGPGFYPRIILGLTAVLAAALLFFSLREKTQPEKRANRNYRLVFGVFLIVGLYVGALPFAGFRIATFLFMTGLQATLEAPKGRRGWMIVAATALITTFATYFLFEKYLSVLLPRGLWTDF